jgi:hypothetical protein
MMLSKGYPTVRLGHNKKTSPARYFTWSIGPRFWKWGLDILIWRTEIRLDWRKKDSSYEQDDFRLTIQALNEETLHFILQKDISGKACSQWDNFTRDLRIALQE